MKYCPSCQTTYTDDSLLFCLQDGTGLLSYSDKSSQMPTEVFGELETVVKPNQMPSAWEQSQVTRVATLQPKAKKSNTHLIIILTAVTMCIFFGGLAAVWFLLSGGTSEKVNIDVGNNNTYNFGITPIANTGERIQSNNTVGNAGTGWEPTNYQASLNGERLTYYRGTTAEQCQADCDRNPKCKAFTLIRSGAYNPNDPPMCYLISEVTDSVASTCCISAIKNKTSNTTETLACEYFLGSGLFDKWKETGGEYGKLGCPIMNEAEAQCSPQGTTGRMTQFSKDDGGYIIWHGSGRFSGMAFEVSGCMFKQYSNMGGTKSWLGFPIKDGYVTPTGARQDFEGGYILWDSKTYVCQAYRN